MRRALKAMERVRASWGLVAVCAVVAGCGEEKSGSPPMAAEERERPGMGPGTTPENETGPKVVFLGDSISAGLHLPGEQAFPSVIKRSLAKDGVSFQLLNAGVSGDTSAGGLRRVDWVLKQQPKIVVVELGANDALRGQPVQEIENNLRGILEKIRAAGVTPLLLGMRIPTSYGEDYANAFEAVYPELAKELGIPFVPFFMDGVAGVAALNLPDGLHPTQEGHVKLARTVQPALAKLLAETK
jgi:acyl-CoA thioesterase I